MKNKYPIYIPSKGRYKTPYTIQAMQKIGAEFSVVVEQQEAHEYAKLVGENNLLILPHSDRGLVVTRNWIWDHAEKIGAEKFWTFDDNIRGFYRLTNNTKYRCLSTTFLRVIEDFVDRYENVPIAGMQYEMFAPRKNKWKPFILNTRVYSNMLISTNAKALNGEKYRNEGFYNDDTDLCLRVLKDGHCTMLFYAFLIDKIATMTVKGGMTPHYQGDGRYKMAKELQEKHPDVVRIIWRFNRWQHLVNYKPFAKNKLRKKDNVNIQTGTNEYGMRLIKINSM